jgi:hypothetical protein
MATRVRAGIEGHLFLISNKHDVSIDYGFQDFLAVVPEHHRAC